MKKSLLNIITLAVLVVNLVLSIVMVFSVVPASSKMNDMITKVCTALDLELESQQEVKGKKEYKIEDMEEIPLDEELTIEVKSSAGDGVKHYGAISLAIVVDNKHEDYATYAESITTKSTLIKDAVTNVIGSFTIEEIQNNKEGVQQAVLERLQKLFDSDFIIRIAYKKWLFQ